MTNINPKPTSEQKAAMKAQQDAGKLHPDVAKLLSQPKKKRICFWPWSHDWQRWISTEEGKIIRTRTWLYTKVGEDANIGNYKVQERTCNNCGKIEINTVRTTIGE